MKRALEWKIGHILVQSEFDMGATFIIFSLASAHIKQRHWKAKEIKCKQ